MWDLVVQNSIELTAAYEVPGIINYLNPHYEAYCFCLHSMPFFL
jgi:hypothetical protein